MICSVFNNRWDMTFKVHDCTKWGQASFAAALSKNQQANSPGLALSGRAMQALKEGKTVTVRAPEPVDPPLPSSSRKP